MLGARLAAPWRSPKLAPPDGRDGRHHAPRDRAADGDRRRAGRDLALQSYINGRLGRSLGSAEVAAALNNAVGLWPSAPSRRSWARSRARCALDHVRFWHVLGGLGGAMYVWRARRRPGGRGRAAQRRARLRADRREPGGRRHRPQPGGAPAGDGGARRGRGLTIAAVVASALGARANLHFGILAFTLVAGVATALQQAANGHLARDTGEPLFAGTVNFAVGFLALLVVAQVAGGLAPPHGWSAPPLEYLGGLLGATIATTMAVIVSRLGVLRLILAMTAGQAVGGLVLDVMAPARGESVTAGTIAGVALAFAAVIVSGRHAPRT